MDKGLKKKLIILCSFFLGILIIFSGLTEKIHLLFLKIGEPILDTYADQKKESLLESIGYFGQFIFAALLLISPMSLAGGLWFLKIAFELAIGENAGLNVFVFSILLNKTIAILCVILFIYSLYAQHIWSIKLTEKAQPKPDNKSLSKLLK